MQDDCKQNKHTWRDMREEWTEEYVFDKLEAENSRLQAENKRLREALEPFMKVMNNRDPRGNHTRCPHGNAPNYPAHGWWCDDCFNALNEALQEADSE